MTAREKRDRIDELKELSKAVKFNHNISGNGSFSLSVYSEEELERYKVGMTQLTLPQRFGMYKTPTKDVPKTTKIELEEPKNNFVDSTSSILAKNPNHKVRGIFG